MIRKAIIPAAGSATRLNLLGKEFPKELLPLVDRPALDWSIEELLANNINEIMIVTSPSKFDAIEKKISTYQAEITLVVQPFPIGLADAVRQGEDWVGDEPFVVLLPDDLVLGDPILKRLIAQFIKSETSTVALTTVKDEFLSNYGIVDSILENRKHIITDIVEKPSRKSKAPSNLSITGRYCFTNEIWEALKDLEPGRNGELQLSDAMKVLAAAGALDGIETKGERHDLGNPKAWLKANIAYAYASYGKDWLNDQRILKQRDRNNI
jgi:UTP--glucose-1-phosphate uridylyltransferase